MLADRYDAYLFDLDGVLLVDGDPLPGAAATVERLRDRDVPVRVVTNNSRSTREGVAEGLSEAGIPFDPDEVFTAARATAGYLAESGHERVSVIGADGFRTEVRRHGIEVVDDPDSDGSGVDAVAVGLDAEFGYDDLTRATRRVLDGASLVAANADATYPVADGIAPGTGAIVAAVTGATGVDPAVVGKPEPRLFRQALDGIEADRPAMIGDSRESDVRGAIRAGVDAVLVAGEAETADPTPDAVIGDLRELFAPEGD
jgi:HAD superfamily hydrolase (TIGR01450 family)